MDPLIAYEMVNSRLGRHALNVLSGESVENVSSLLDEVEELKSPLYEPVKASFLLSLGELEEVKNLMKNYKYDPYIRELILLHVYRKQGHSLRSALLNSSPISLGALPIILPPKYAFKLNYNFTGLFPFVLSLDTDFDIFTDKEMVEKFLKMYARGFYIYRDKKLHLPRFTRKYVELGIKYVILLFDPDAFVIPHDTIKRMARKEYVKAFNNLIRASKGDNNAFKNLAGFVENEIGEEFLLPFALNAAMKRDILLDPIYVLKRKSIANAIAVRDFVDVAIKRKGIDYLLKALEEFDPSVRPIVRYRLGRHLNNAEMIRKAIEEAGHLEEERKVQLLALAYTRLCVMRDIEGCKKAEEYIKRASRTLAYTTELPRMYYAIDDVLLRVSLLYYMYTEVKNTHKILTTHPSDFPDFVLEEEDKKKIEELPKDPLEARNAVPELAGKTRGGNHMAIGFFPKILEGRAGASSKRGYITYVPTSADLACSIKFNKFEAFFNAYDMLMYIYLRIYLGSLKSELCLKRTKRMYESFGDKRYKLFVSIIDGGSPEALEELIKLMKNHKVPQELAIVGSIPPGYKNIKKLYEALAENFDDLSYRHELPLPHRLLLLTTKATEESGLPEALRVIGNMINGIIIIFPFYREYKFGLFPYARFVVTAFRGDRIRQLEKALEYSILPPARDEEAYALFDLTPIRLPAGEDEIGEAYKKGLHKKDPKRFLELIGDKADDRIMVMLREIMRDTGYDVSKKAEEVYNKIGKSDIAFLAYAAIKKGFLEDLLEMRLDLREYMHTKVFLFREALYANLYEYFKKEPDKALELALDITTLIGFGNIHEYPRKILMRMAEERPNGYAFAIMKILEITKPRDIEFSLLGRYF